MNILERYVYENKNIYGNALNDTYADNENPIFEIRYGYENEQMAAPVRQKYDRQFNPIQQNKLHMNRATGKPPVCEASMHSVRRDTVQYSSAYYNSKLAQSIPALQRATHTHIKRYKGKKLLQVQCTLLQIK
jgi:hypothetical protein